MHIGYWSESQKERNQQEDEDTGGWIILKWIRLRIGTSGGSSERGNEPLDFIKC
jgi:hypothetical protein